jgi:hypothetical protein
MDVIALRKGGGEISGEVLLNGFPQDKVSFRRCSGYVEQFDVQSAGKPSGAKITAFKPD